MFRTTVGAAWPLRRSILGRRASPSPSAAVLRHAQHRHAPPTWSSMLCSKAARRRARIFSIAASTVRALVGAAVGGGGGTMRISLALLRPPGASLPYECPVYGVLPPNVSAVPAVPGRRASFLLLRRDVAVSADAAVPGRIDPAVPAVPGRSIEVYLQIRCSESFAIAA